MRASGEPQRGSATLDRSVILSQLLFGVALIVVVFTLQAFAPGSMAKPLVLAGIVLAFTVTGVTVVTLCHRLPRECVIIVPVLDIVAIGLMRIGDQAAGVGLLWVFPTIWLSSYFGVLGAIIAVG